MAKNREKTLTLIFPTCRKKCMIRANIKLQNIAHKTPYEDFGWTRERTELHEGINAHL